MTANSNSKISDLILHNHLVILPLEHFGIDLAVNEKTVLDICSETNLNIELILAIINLFNGEKLVDINKLKLEDIKSIVNYLKNCHQYYLEEKCPNIGKYIRLESETNNCPEMALVEKFFNDYMTEVTNHLNYENFTVFPYVENLACLFESKQNADSADYSVLEYRDHHDDIEEKLIDLKNLLIKYLPIDGDQILRRNLLFELFEFESDLNIHSLIEENLLMPLVEQLENKLAQ